MPDFDLDAALTPPVQSEVLKCQGTRCKASRLTLVRSGTTGGIPTAYSVSARCLECGDGDNFIYRLAGLENLHGYSLENVDACAYAMEATCPHCDSVGVTFENFEVPLCETPFDESISNIGKLQVSCETCQHHWVEVYKHEEEPRA